MWKKKIIPKPCLYITPQRRILFLKVFKIEEFKNMLYNGLKNPP